MSRRAERGIERHSAAAAQPRDDEEAFRREPTAHQYRIGPDRPGFAFAPVAGLQGGMCVTQREEALVQRERRRVRLTSELIPRQLARLECPDGLWVWNTLAGGWIG